MEWLDRFNKALGYIDENLENDISPEHLSQIASCSVFHFNRMFSYIVGMPLSQYIRNRKMTVASFDLQTTDIKIIDIALKYGYESPTAFNRAFKSVHGIAPSKARKKGIQLTAFPPMSLTLHIKGEEKMNYKIESKDAFRVVGVSKHYEMNLEENFKEVPKFWQKTMITGKIPKILKLNDMEPKALLGVSTCMNGKDFDYYIASASSLEKPSKFSEFTVPSCTWGIFECVGPLPNSIQDLQKRIVTEWLPTSGYEYADAPDIEVYFEGDQKSADYVCEVWIPLVKK
ncbi:AraC family transcriptional regulator [Acidaminobacter sp. JC074]|uniref:AraC family transcriptional regulator n=1 Tax=Acidaminobacter sp. JC074 TaxID=2530199 RepID=UPI001F0DDA54|nr:AraC family transcriptional regulator [Acidaminobacter sp. JC074]MCH4888471.1 AraC family transcriptional regulator [Acidaminobacter sp. JC074]